MYISRAVSLARPEERISRQGNRLNWVAREAAEISQLAPKQVLAALFRRRALLEPMLQDLGYLLSVQVVVGVKHLVVQSN